MDEFPPAAGRKSPYAASKIAADKLAESFANSFDLPVVVLRPFNTYGPRQSARAIIPAILAQALSGAEQIELGNLAPQRDLTFVEDTARAFALAAEAEGIDGGKNHPFWAVDRGKHRRTGRALPEGNRQFGADRQRRPAAAPRLRARSGCCCAIPRRRGGLLGWEPRRVVGRRTAADGRSRSRRPRRLPTTGVCPMTTQVTPDAGATPSDEGVGPQGGHLGRRQGHPATAVHRLLPQAASPVGEPTNPRSALALFAASMASAT